MADAVQLSHDIHRKSTGSLANVATNTLQLFADLALIAPDGPETFGIPVYLSLNTQHERLALWVSNLAVTHVGHSSLDYRLREADSVRDAIESFLNDLCESLLECEVRQDKIRIWYSPVL